jgi:hypothetical protein
MHAACAVVALNHSLRILARVPYGAAPCEESLCCVLRRPALLRRLCSELLRCVSSPAGGLRLTPAADRAPAQAGRTFLDGRIGDVDDTPFFSPDDKVRSTRAWVHAVCRGACGSSRERGEVPGRERGELTARGRGAGCRCGTSTVRSRRGSARGSIRHVTPGVSVPCGVRFGRVGPSDTDSRPCVSRMWGTFRISTSIALGL